MSEQVTLDLQDSGVRTQEGHQVGGWEQLKQWAGMLRAVCAEDPRLVLRAIAQPDKLTQHTEDQKWALQEFVWEYGGRERARRQFNREGMDTDKAMGVVEFLRRNVSNGVHRVGGGGKVDYSKTYQEYYSYDEGDIELVRRLTEVSDDPVSLLGKVGGVVDYEELGKVNIDVLATYAERIAHNPRAMELMSRMDELPSFKRIGIGGLWETESGDFQWHHEDDAITEPMEVLKGMTDEEYVRLVSPENLSRAQALWREISHGKAMPLEFLPNILRIADDQIMQGSFKEMMKSSYEKILNYYKEFSYQNLLRAEVKLREKLNVAPELWDLYEAGFDMGVWFEHDNYHIESLAARRADWQDLTADERLMGNARILKRYGRKMLPYPSTYAGENYYRRSDPNRLEAALIIVDRANGRVVRGDNEVSDYNIWEGIDDNLSELDLDEIDVIFSAFVSEEVDADLKVDVGALVHKVGSVEELRSRVATVLRPEVAEMVKDRQFVDMVFGWMKHANGGYWFDLLDNPEAYLRLYTNRELLARNLDILMGWREDQGAPLMDESVALYESIVELTPDEVEDIRAEFWSGQVRLKPENLTKFKLLAGVAEGQKRKIEERLNLMGVQVSGLFDDRLSVDGLRHYFSMDEVRQEEVLGLLERQLERSFWRLKQEHSGNEVPLEFLCELVRHPEWAGRIEIMLNAFTDRSSGHFNLTQAAEVMKAFQRLILSHRGDVSFNIDNYVDAQGIVGESWLEELAAFEVGGRELDGRTSRPWEISVLLINENALAKMGPDSRSFWGFWSSHDFRLLREYTWENRSESRRLIVDGKATEALVDRLSSEQVIDIYSFDRLLTDEMLGRMSERGRKFWGYWKAKEPYTRKILLDNREIFDTLVVEGKPTAKLIGLIARWAPVEYEKVDYDLLGAGFSLEDRRSIRSAWVTGLANLDGVDHRQYFESVYRCLSLDLAENGSLGGEYSETVRKLYGVDLEEGWVRQIDRFHEEAMDRRYDALIPDREAYWRQNAFLLVQLNNAGWQVPSFDRFRSIAQNPESNRILWSVDPDSLRILTSAIGLGIHNLYYVDRSSLDWLMPNMGNEVMAQFFRRIINEKPTSFNSCISAFRTLEAHEIQIVMTEPLYTERMLAAIEEFGNVSPTLVRGYVMESDDQLREAFRKKVDIFRERVHQNLPIMDLAEGEYGLELVAEMICLTYPGTNLDQVKRELGLVGDHCQDVEGLVIREGGYKGKIVSREKVAELARADRLIDEGVVNLVKRVFARDLEPQYVANGGDTAYAMEGWVRLLKEAGATNQKHLFAEALLEVVACARVSLGDKIELFTERMSGDTSQVAAKNAILSKSKELFGIYYKDNAAEAIDAFLVTNPEAGARLLGLLSPKRLASLRRNVGGSREVSEESRLEFNEIVDGLEAELPEAERRMMLARLLAYMTERTMFAGSRGLRKMVSMELEKIVLRDKEGLEVDPTLIMTGYVSKNAASYFAKTTAAVCTAGDSTLFGRSDHFHLNPVDKNGVCVGNIQGYRVVYNDKPGLVFRGFNPSTRIVSAENVAVLGDQMVDWVRQIAADNDMYPPMIPEQDGWHPLTNRVGEGMDRYLQARFCRPENLVEFGFDITGTKAVRRFYLMLDRGEAREE